VNKSLRHKLLYSYIAVVVLVLAGVSVGISLLLREYFIASKQQELANKGYELGRIVESYNDGRIDNTQFVNFLNGVDTFLDARVWIVDSTRKVVAISTPRRMGPGMGRGPGGGMGRMGGGMQLRAITPELESVFSGQLVARSFYHPAYEENMLIVAVPLVKADGTVTGAVVLNSPIRGIDEFLQRLYYYIGALGLLALLLAILAARRLADGIISPLKAMQQSAAAMAQGDYATRINITDGDEVGELGKSLNSLAQELGRFVDNTARMEKTRRDFVANVSHELRTPLTIIRGYTEALLDGTVIEAAQAEKYHRLMRDETVRLEGLINELLDLSRLQAETTPLAQDIIPLGAIAESCVGLLRQRAGQNGVTLDYIASSNGTEVTGDGNRLTQLLLILLDNALKFTSAGGRITVRVNREDGKTVLVVSDTGTGIAAEDLPHIWERFYKADKAHTRTAPGTGLGLAIAREIINRHKAGVEVVSKSGQGSSFIITFPEV
jgi:signal transduction histidine kinase